MDKIKELLAQIGASEELVAQICEALDAWKDAQKKQIDEEFQARLVKAKELVRTLTIRGGLRRPVAPAASVTGPDW